MVELIWIREKLFGPTFVSANNSLTFSPYIISQLFFFSLSYLMASLFSDSFICSSSLYSQAFLHLLLILITPSSYKCQKRKATAVSKAKEHAPM